ncbi:DUF1559 domain-containing protein [Botrimarina sp.]|uniref:DUF1559 domain-containing protein n=1 Tax=Botrimarina sp. TaxID=2795802 RepID=UPI0032ED51A4
MKIRTTRPSAFTLVELLVVIAIIGILVAMLLPAVQSAREAARRTQCVNQLKQMGLACLNLYDTYEVFPSGGTRRYPTLENYSENGSANGPKRQGLGWAFQILPFLEENAVHGLATQADLDQVSVGMYFCPSRRGPTRNLAGGATNFRMDYCAVTPGPPPLALDQSGYYTGLARYVYYGYTTNQDEPRRATGPFDGVIVRTPYDIMHVGGLDPNPSDNVAVRDWSLTRVAQITDGTSKTILLAEKRLEPQHYESSEYIWYDDRGWTDGWDPDTIRSTMYPVGPDSSEEEAQADYPDEDPGLGQRIAFCLGSAHPGGVNTAFADGSVRAVGFDTDRQLLNLLAHKSDGEVVDVP